MVTTKKQLCSAALFDESWSAIPIAIKNSGTTLDFTQTIIKTIFFFDNSQQIVPNNKSKSVSLFVHHNALW
jgi:hypothetical protein